MQHRIPIDRLGPRAETMAEAVEACVHCGFCLPTCPTYRTLGEEMDSPRGRITLMKAMLEDELPLEEGLPFVDRCLGCVACVTACPSGVEYGELVTSFRLHAEESRRRPLVERWLRASMLRVLSSPPLMRVGARGGLLAKAVFSRSSFLRQRLPRLGAALELLPAKVPPRRAWPEIVPAEGRRQARVALLRGCAQDVLAPRITQAAASVLARRGVEVLIPGGQGCCGALALHAGDGPRAKRLARRNVAAFPDDVDAIITTAAGCGSGMADYPLLFAGDNAHESDQEKARKLAARSLDISTFLAGLEALPTRAQRPLRVAYQDACHLAHAQKERASPRRLLGAIENLELIDIEPWHQCCGSAGIYNLEEPEIARRLGRQKAEAILASDADLVASGNIGCLMQIEHHLRLLDQPVSFRPMPVLHSVEILDLAERGELGAE